MRLPRQEISDAASETGWRLILGELRTWVRCPSLAAAASLAERVAARVDAGDHLRMDVRADGLYLSLTTPAESFVTARDLDLAQAISAIAGELGLACQSDAGDRPVQTVEIAIDALDIPAVMPFWQAVLEYTPDGTDALLDPAGQGPSVWFQQMDAPRPQRNRVHFDVVVPHDEAKRRMDAALAAGGRVTYDAEAPAFWVLADPEGNEACICTWQGRD